MLNLGKPLDFAHVAQGIEQGPPKSKVTGSNPVVGAAQQLPAL